MLQIVRQEADKVVALCPFHNDHQASLVINLTGKYAGRYRCFGCGATGWASELQQGFTVMQTGPDLTRCVYPQIAGFMDALMPATSSKDQILGLATSWGVSVATLQQFDVVWNGETYCAPMRNGFEELIGVHQRAPDGSKRCVRGSRLGLFLPVNIGSCTQPLFICEGLSDTAVVASYGCRAIGRASACSCLEHLVAYASQCACPAGVVIVADSDDVGQKSASRIQQCLRSFIEAKVMSVAPFKDARDMHQHGGRHDQLQELLLSFGGGSHAL